MTDIKQFFSTKFEMRKLSNHICTLMQAAIDKDV